MSKREPTANAAFDPNAVFATELLHVLEHPMRVEILSLLARGPGSASSLAPQMGQTVSHVSYHLASVLYNKYGFVKIVRTREGPLADEHFYSVDWEKIRMKIDWPMIPEPARSALRSTAAVPFLRELMQVLESGAAEDEETTLVWHPATVDSIGWNEVRQILSTAQESVTTAVASSSSRLEKEEGLEPIQIQIGFAAFEVASEAPRLRRV